jgi:type VI secretion system protein ImpB
VETGGAIVKRELPLVVGILAGLSGDKTDLPALKDRKFVEIDRDNFDAVLEKAAPVLAKCTIDDKGCKRSFDPPLKVTSLDSFTPFEIVKQVPSLHALFKSRSLLADLVAKLDGNLDLEKELKDIAKNPEVLQITSGPSPANLTTPASKPVVSEPAEPIAGGEDGK